MTDPVVGAGGHNGPVAACHLAETGRRVVVLEAADEPGGADEAAPRSRRSRRRPPFRRTPDLVGARRGCGG